jgi:hypothetical protein
MGGVEGCAPATRKSVRHALGGVEGCATRPVNNLEAKYNAASIGTSPKVMRWLRRSRRV